MTARLSEGIKKRNRKKSHRTYVIVHSLIGIFWEAASLEGQQLHTTEEDGLVFPFDRKSSILTNN